jgi:hypothetical protein
MPENPARLTIGNLEGYRWHKRATLSGESKQVQELADMLIGTKASCTAAWS